MTLDELQIGQSATLTTVGGEGALRQHFLDMGLIPRRRGDTGALCAFGRSHGDHGARL